MLQHAVLTLDGTAQSLLSAFGAAEPPGGANDPACTFIALQAGAANSNAVFVGGPDVSASDYGARIPIPVTTIPEVPFTFPAGYGVVRLSSVWVIGTNAEVLHILYVWL